MNFGLGVLVWIHYEFGDEGGLGWGTSRAYMQHFSETLYTSTLKSMDYGIGGVL